MIIFIRHIGSHRYKIYTVSQKCSRCSDVCCDEFPMPQNENKLISKRTVTWKILFAMQYGERFAILNTENKVEATKNAICLLSAENLKF